MFSRAGVGIALVAGRRASLLPCGDRHRHGSRRLCGNAAFVGGFQALGTAGASTPAASHWLWFITHMHMLAVSHGGSIAGGRMLGVGGLVLGTAGGGVLVYAANSSGQPAQLAGNPQVDGVLVASSSDYQLHQQQQQHISWLWALQNKAEETVAPSALLRSHPMTKNFVLQDSLVSSLCQSQWHLMGA
jgi:hypothetical protein